MVILRFNIADMFPKRLRKALAMADNRLIMFVDYDERAIDNW